MTDTNTDLLATRWSLLGRLKDWQDQASWGEFFETYWRLIYSVAIKAGLSDAEAQDVVQETLLTVARKIQKFKCDPAAGSFKAWLLTVTRWRILNQFKKRQPRGTQHARQMPLPAPVPLPPSQADETAGTQTVERVPDPASLDLDAVWDTEWEQQVLAAARERVKHQVSARDFQVFELYGLQDWPVREVARMLHINVAQVYLAKHRVGKLLKQEIQRLRQRMDGAVDAPLKPSHPAPPPVDSPST